ncbi:MAG: hypothetical protein ACE5GN_02980, partial [Waddliaceae bacterium]
MAIFQNRPNVVGASFDYIFFQTWFDLASTQIHELTNLIKAQFPAAKIIYLDWFAPLDLRYAEALEPFIDYYVKKHVFMDQSQYGRATFGDTNL